MKKNELIEAMVKKTGATKAATEKTLNAFVETVIEALKEGTAKFTLEKCTNQWFLE